MTRLSRMSALWLVGLLVAALFVGASVPAAAAPFHPSTPSGPSCGKVNTSYSFETDYSGIHVGTLYLRFIWGDGSMSDYEAEGWLGGVSALHAWNTHGTYSVRAQAKDATGESPLSDPHVIVIPDAPTAPPSLTAISRTSLIILVWTAPTDTGGAPITNYRIYRQSGPPPWPFPPPVYAMVGNVLTYPDTGVTDGTAYRYWVSAANCAENGPRSPLASAVPGVPDAPTLTSAAAGAKQVTLTWTAPSYEGSSAITGYRIYRGTTPGEESFVAATTDPGTYVDTGLADGQMYCYQVSAENRAGEGPASNERCVSTPTVAEAPASLSAEPGDRQVALTWTAPASDGNSAVSNYTIYRGTASGSLSLVATLEDVLSYTDTGLTNGVTYFFQVSAVNAVGEGPRSVEVTAKPTESGKPSVTITSPVHLSTVNQNTVTVTGTASDGDAVAKVELSTDGVTWVTATGTTSWSGTLTLTSGSNTIYARATDLSGNTQTSSIEVTVELGTAGKEGGQGLPVWAIALVIVGIAAAAVAVAFVLQRRRRRPV